MGSTQPSIPINVPTASQIPRPLRHHPCLPYGRHLRSHPRSPLPQSHPLVRLPAAPRRLHPRPRARRHPAPNRARLALARPGAPSMTSPSSRVGSRKPASHPNSISCQKSGRALLYPDPPQRFAQQLRSLLTPLCLPQPASAPQPARPAPGSALAEPLPSSQTRCSPLHPRSSLPPSPYSPSKAA
jgi:hypothetical protein